MTMRYAIFLLSASLAFAQTKPTPQKGNERGLKVEKLDKPLPGPKAQTDPSQLCGDRGGQRV